MKVPKRLKTILTHAAYSAGAVLTAAALAYVSAHGADLVGQKNEVFVGIALIPLLEALRKWFQTRASKSEGDTPPSSK